MCIHISQFMYVCIYSPKYIVYVCMYVCVCVYPKEDKFRFLLTLKI